MEDCLTRIVYRSERASLYENIFTDQFNTKRCFYCLIVGQDAYSLTKEEGDLLEKTVGSSFHDFHYEGIELTLVDFSSLRHIDKLH